MTEIKLDLSIDPGELTRPGNLSRLIELSPEFHRIAGATGKGEWMGFLGDVEIAALKPEDWVTQLAKVSHAYEAAHQLVHSQDELLGQTMASFGRL